MQNKRTVTKVAAVALMLSAFASPLAANAATAPLSNFYTAALTKAGEGWSLPAEGSVAAGKAIALVDPLALAKQYAPDTASDWEKTLAAFNKLVKNVTLTATTAALPDNLKIAGKSVTVTGKPVSEDELKQVKWTTAKPVTITIGADGKTTTIHADGKPVTIANPDNVKVAGQAVTVTGKPVSEDELKQIKWTTAKPVTITNGKTGESQLQEVRALTPEELKAIKLTAAQAVPVASSSITISGDFKDADGKPVTITNQASPLFSGQLELSKAAESKDAEAIKQALANLLELYKAEIDKLQQAE